MERVNKVVWNPGNFGNLLVRTLEAHYLNKVPELKEEAHSHNEPIVSNYIKIQHSFNHVKYQIPNKISFSIEDFVRTYWNFQEPLIPKNNLDMGTFFFETDAWIESLELILNGKISSGIRAFLNTKAILNQNLLRKFFDRSKINSDILFAIRICEYINGEEEKFYQLEKSLDSIESLKRYV